MITVGYTGTRHGMTAPQGIAVIGVLEQRLNLGSFTARHGDCIGGDRQFHTMCRAWDRGRVRVVGHPPVADRHRAFCAFDEELLPEPYHARNREIVRCSDVMIAAPAETVPQARGGGTWSTIRMAVARARSCELRLFVVYPHGGVCDSWTSIAGCAL